MFIHVILVFMEGLFLVQYSSVFVFPYQIENIIPHRSSEVGVLDYQVQGLVFYQNSNLGSIS